MREISDDLIKAHADRRFRSEYDYALFEYYRSAKVIALLDRAGVAIGGRVLDAGCGGGGMPLSLAEHATRGGRASIRSTDSATPACGWHASGASPTCISSVPTAWRCRLPTAAFDLVLSHAVIEHVADATAVSARVPPRAARRMGAATCRRRRICRLPARTCRACACRCRCTCSLGRPVAFRTFRLLARRAPWTLREPAHENSFIRDARRGIAKEDDLLEKVRVRRLRTQIAAAGLRLVREELHADRDDSPAAGAAGALAARQPADAGRAHQ